MYFCKKPWYNRPMFIEIKTTKHPDLISTYVINILKELNVDRRKRYDIIIKFPKRMPNGYGDSFGVCEGDKADSIIHISNKQSFFEQMITLAHELVHAKQFFEGRYPSEREAISSEYHLFGKCFPFHALKNGK